MGEEKNDADFIGSGMDCAVIPLAKHKNICLVQSVDFFYPLLDDPVIMGRIALANVISDVYAVGITNIDKLEMLISSPTEFSEKESAVVIPKIIEGFCVAAKDADCEVHIRHIQINPWCIIGGIASSVSLKNEIIMPSGAKKGDVIILTKPLGTQLATACYVNMSERNTNYTKLSSHYSDGDVEMAYQIAVRSMSYLNKNGALLMCKYAAHCATDVTGFGLLGHAKNLAEYQTDSLIFEINTLPVIRNVLGFETILNNNSKLVSGKAVETSGGLLLCLPADKALDFCNEFKAITKNEQQAWIIGKVTAGDNRDAVLTQNPQIIEVDF